MDFVPYRKLNDVEIGTSKSDDDDQHLDPTHQDQRNTIWAAFAVNTFCSLTAGALVVSVVCSYRERAALLPTPPAPPGPSRQSTSVHGFTHTS